jgi:CubicO group peptidase (beta-lactamase class C family)
MHSVSKTFTSMAIGFAVQEGLIEIDNKVVSFFPDDLPDELSPGLQELEILDLLTMTVGHNPLSLQKIKTYKGSWEQLFLARPIIYEPGTIFAYNSMATYMLSAIIQKVSGKTVLDYLQPRLLGPLGISGAEWEESPSGVKTGGWGLYIKTEDMAKLGQFLLQKGKWEGKQLLSQLWIEEASSVKVKQRPFWVSPEADLDQSDWGQGYGYQIWRNRPGGYRADGAMGQYIIVLPEKEVVIVTTANISDTQAELNLIWEYILPAFK